MLRMNIDVIIDSHCHLHDPAFEDVRGALARRDRARRVGRRRRRVRLRHQRAHPRAAAGTHGKTVLARAWASTRTGSSSPTMTSSWWKRRWRRITRGWSPSARSGCRGTAWARRADAAEVLTRGRERLARLLDLAAALRPARHSPRAARRRGGRPRGAQASRHRARGVPLAQGARRGDPGHRGGRATSSP